MVDMNFAHQDGRFGVSHMHINQTLRNIIFAARRSSRHFEKPYFEGQTSFFQLGNLPYRILREISFKNQPLAGLY